MSESWLSTPDQGGDYLGLDDPPMPDGALEPPTAPPAGMQHGGQVSDTQGGWLASDSAVATAQAPAQAPGSWNDLSGEGAWDAPPSDSPAARNADAANAHAAAHQPPPTQAYPAQAPRQQAVAMAPTGHGMGELSVGPPQLERVHPSPRSVGGARGQLSDLVLDVEVQVQVALGSAALTVEEFLEMGRGSVVELDRPVDAPIELRVRGKLVARGQLVAINGSYGMRIVEMLGENA